MGPSKKIQPQAWHHLLKPPWHLLLAVTLLPSWVSVSVSFKLQHIVLLCHHAERLLPVHFDGAHPLLIAAPPLRVSSLRCDLRGAEHPLQTQLGPEGLAEDEIDERVQADVENRHHDGQLLQVEERLAPRALPPLERVGKPNQVVRDKANAEDADQHQHVPTWLGKLLGTGGRRLPLLRQRQPAGGAVVEEDQGDKDEQEDGGGAGVDDFVEQAELFTVQDVTADSAGDRG